jgi:hypothetical protein
VTPARRREKLMVDATFIFVLLFGGALVGLVSGLVRRRGSAGASIEVVAGAVFGWIGPGLLMHVPGVSQAMLAALRRFGVDEQSAALAGSDVVYLSPVIGGFVGVAAVSLVRLMIAPSRADRYGEHVGADAARAAALDRAHPCRQWPDALVRGVSVTRRRARSRRKAEARSH